MKVMVMNFNQNGINCRSLYMREDAVTEGGCRRQMLKLASKTDEDYYVAPPGETLQIF